MQRGNRIIRSVVTDGPDAEPLALDDVKVNLKLSPGDSEDDLLDLLIQAAREYVEEETGLSLMTQTRVIKLDEFPNCDTIQLTAGPIQNITTVKYQDPDDTEQTFAASNYWLDAHSHIPRIVVKDSWPATETRPNAVTITYEAGFGDAATDVPTKLREACMTVVAWLYENRDQRVPSNLVDGLIGPHTVVQDVTY